jgi:hypothetical protein
MHRVITICILVYALLVWTKVSAFYEDPCDIDYPYNEDCLLINSVNKKINNKLSWDLELSNSISDLLFEKVLEHKDNARISNALNTVLSWIINEVEKISAVKKEKIFKDWPFRLINEKIFFNMDAIGFSYRYVPTSIDNISEFSCSSEKHCIYKIWDNYYASVWLWWTALQKISFDPESFERINWHFRKDSKNVWLFLVSYWSSVKKISWASPQFFLVDITLPAHLQDYYLQSIHRSTDGNTVFADRTALNWLKLQDLKAIDNWYYGSVKFYSDWNHIFMLTRSPIERWYFKEVVWISYKDAQECVNKDAITIICNWVEISK